MFPLITGSIYNSLRTTELNMKWQERKKDPNWASMDQRSKEIARLQETAANIRKSNETSAIDGKLRAGAELSPQELEYLKQTNPQLYQEALQIAQERKAYERELENCETKDEVEQVKAAKMQQMLAQAKTISSNPNIPEGEKYNQLMKIMRRTMGICGEHNEFVKTARYASLPRKHELEEEERERKKERTGETDEPAEELKPYLNDGEMEQKLEELANEALKNGSPEPAAGSETKDQPETGSAEKPAAPKSTGGKDAPPSHSRVPAESRAYDARGSVKPGPQPAKARLDIKR